MRGLLSHASRENAVRDSQGLKTAKVVWAGAERFLLDLPELDRDKKLEANNQAMDAASLAFTRTALG
jgi:hypothetical protein